jgi:hypothetical protein
VEGHRARWYSAIFANKARSDARAVEPVIKEPSSPTLVETKVESTGDSVETAAVNNASQGEGDAAESVLDSTCKLSLAGDRSATPWMPSLSDADSSFSQAVEPPKPHHSKAQLPKRVVYVGPESPLATEGAAAGSGHTTPTT